MILVLRHAIPSGVRVKRVGAAVSHVVKIKELLNFVLEVTFPMSRFFQEVLCFMKCAPAQCSPNAVRVMVGFLNLSQFFDLDLTIDEFRYFFNIGRIDGVGSCDPPICSSITQAREIMNGPIRL
ncbi:hypothetical protein PS2_037880 [Malus domestica]